MSTKPNKTVKDDTNKNKHTSEAIEDEDELKREKRRAANRRSARKSRYREMVMLDELQRNTRALTSQNSALRQENDSLRSLISTVKKYEDRVRQLQLSGMQQLLSSPFLNGGNSSMPPPASNGISYESILHALSQSSNASLASLDQSSSTSSQLPRAPRNAKKP